METVPASGSPGPATAIESGSVGGESGYWLRNAAVECFVTAQRRIRLLVLRRVGGQNLLNSAGGLNDGLRPWLMTPHEVEHERDALASLEGSIEPDGGGLRVRIPAPPALGLALEWAVSLHPREPELTVDHLVRNEGDATREVAIWPVIGIAAPARLVLPFRQVGSRARDTRVLYHFPWSTLRDERISAGTDHVQLEITDVAGDAHVKFGVFQATGSGGALIGDSVLVSTTPLEPGRTYPEGGPNLTVYASPVVAGKAFGELENVGALHRLGRNESTSLRQVLSIEEAANSPFLRSVGYPAVR
jgi:hypothetical protein